MTAVNFLRPVFAGSFPPAMDPGVLYVSIPYRTCGHLCCCGCGQEVITPLSPAQWSLTYDGENVSLTPSIGNWALPCRSHYWIRKGKVRRSRRYSPAEITENRERDRRRLDRQDAETTPGPSARAAHGPGDPASPLARHASQEHYDDRSCRNSPQPAGGPRATGSAAQRPKPAESGASSADLTTMPTKEGASEPDQCPPDGWRTSVRQLRLLLLKRQEARIPSSLLGEQRHQHGHRAL